MIKTIDDLYDLVFNPEPTELAADDAFVIDAYFPAERYAVDYADDFHKHGLIQIDTDQDCANFGLWASPRQLTILRCCEGDWTRIICPDAETYNARIQNIIDNHQPAPAVISYDTDTGQRTEHYGDRGALFATTT